MADKPKSSVVAYFLIAAAILIIAAAMIQTCWPVFALALSGNISFIILSLIFLASLAGLAAFMVRTVRDNGWIN